MPKSVEEIQADYTRLCASLGQEVLKLLAASQEIQQRVGALNKEHQELIALQQAEDKKNAKNQTETKPVSGDADGASEQVPDKAQVSG